MKKGTRSTITAIADSRKLAERDNFTRVVSRRYRDCGQGKKIPDRGENQSGSRIRHRALLEKILLLSFLTEPFRIRHRNKYVTYNCSVGNKLNSKMNISTKRPSTTVSFRLLE